MNSKMKWNTKHKVRINNLQEPVPNKRLENLQPYLNGGGKALDLACGLGGNSVFLANQNYFVDALDISEVAINHLQEQAKKHTLNVHPRVCDLTETNSLPSFQSSYDLVVMTYYLDRSLFVYIKTVLKENGYFFMETYYQAPEDVNQGISSQYKLRSHELLGEFSEWKVLFYEENEYEGRQTIFCQKVKKIESEATNAES